MDFIACSLRNFNVSDYSSPIEIELNGEPQFHIMYKTSEIEMLEKTHGYVKCFGTDELKRVQGSFVGFAASEATNRNKEKRNILVNNYYALFQLFSNALWFIKDNPITPYFTTLSSDEPIEPASLRRNVYYSTSQGSYNAVVFNSEEIIQALEWFNILDGFTVKAKVTELNGFHQPLFNMSNHLSLDIPSFSRAFHFLDSARKSDFLPAKVASYISVLETLLAVKGDNTHKTSERVAALIGGDELEKWELFNEIKTAYGIRSDYIHGSFIKHKINQTLPAVSQGLDNIVRRVFKEMILNHSELNYDTASNNSVNNAFNRMVLK